MPYPHHTMCVCLKFLVVVSKLNFLFVILFLIGRELRDRRVALFVFRVNTVHGKFQTYSQCQPKYEKRNSETRFCVYGYTAPPTDHQSNEKGNEIFGSANTNTRIRSFIFVE